MDIASVRSCPGWLTNDCSSRSTLLVDRRITRLKSYGVFFKQILIFLGRAGPTEDQQAVLANSELPQFPAPLRSLMELHPRRIQVPSPCSMLASNLILCTKPATLRIV